MRKKKGRSTPGDLEGLFQKAMARFECTVCGTCCQGEGGIYLTAEEIQQIADFLDLTPQAFLTRYCLKKNGKIYIHVREDGFCHFSKEGKCSIHPVKPGPCRKWPFFDAVLKDQANWEVARNSCPALAPFKTLDDFLANRLDSSNSRTDEID
jgi:hypothetical protein